MLELYKDQDGVYDLIYHHLPTEKAFEACGALNTLPHTTYLETYELEVVGLISYFKFDNLDFDIIMAMHRDNVFSTTMFRKLYKLITARTKEIRIDSDGSNTKLIEFASRHGGYFEDNTMVFPKPYEG